MLGENAVRKHIKSAYYAELLVGARSDYSKTEEIKIYASPDVIEHYLRNDLIEFNQLVKDVRVRLIGSYSAAMFEELRAGTADFVITSSADITEDLEAHIYKKGASGASSGCLDQSKKTKISAVSYPISHPMVCNDTETNLFNFLKNKQGKTECRCCCDTVSSNELTTAIVKKISLGSHVTATNVQSNRSQILSEHKPHTPSKHYSYTMHIKKYSCLGNKARELMTFLLKSYPTI